MNAKAKLNLILITKAPGVESESELFFQVYYVWIYHIVVRLTKKKSVSSMLIAKLDVTSRNYRCFLQESEISEFSLKHTFLRL